MCWDHGVALRVLYVEDDPALRGILTAILGGRQDLDVVATAGSLLAWLVLAVGELEVR